MEKYRLVFYEMNELSSRLTNLVLEHKEKLLREFYELKSRTMSEITTNEQENDEKCMELDSYIGQCHATEIKTVADPSTAADDLHARALKLRDMTFSDATTLFEIKLSSSAILNKLTKDKFEPTCNIIGRIDSQMSGMYSYFVSTRLQKLICVANRNQ